MAEAVNITKENFESEVIKSDKTVLLDFWASWCGPCRMMAPIVDEIAKEDDSVKVCKVNIDEQGELAGLFEVMSIPTFVVVKNGKVVNKSIGAAPKDSIINMLKSEL